MRFSQREIRDLFLAWLLLSIAFAILFTDFSSIFSLSYLILLGMSALTVGIGFLFHELAHKIVAQRYGLHAEFVAYYRMILLAVALAFLGFIIAAPGAVIISGFITRRRNGIISVAGPVTNIVLAILFLIPSLFISQGLLGTFLSLGFGINALLALFNMIPVMPFDGAKVIVWDKSVYYTTVVIAALLFIFSLVQGFLI